MRSHLVGENNKTCFKKDNIRLDGSPSSASLGKDYEFIIKKYYFNWMKLFGESKAKP